MRKWLLVGILGALLLLLVVLPILVGFALERAYPSLLESARDQLGESYRVEGHLDRGLLSSTAETTLRPLAGDAAAPPIRLHHRWVHGPFPLAELLEGRVPFPPVLVVVRTEAPAASLGLALAPASGEQSLVKSAVRVNFDGTLDIDVVARAFELADGRFASQGMTAEIVVQGGVRGARGSANLGPWQRVEGERRVEIAASALRFHATQTAAGSQLEGSFDLGASGLLDRDGAGLRFSPSYATFRARRAPNELDASSLDLALGDLEIAVADAGSSPSGFVRGAHIRLDMRSAPGQLVRLEVALSLDSLEWKEESLGRGRVRGVLRGVDVSAAAEFSQALAALRASTEAAPSSLDEQAGLLGRWLPVLTRMSPEFEVERFEWEGPDGKLEGQGWLKVDGSDPAAFAQESTAMEAIEGRASLAVPATLVHRLLEAFLSTTVEAQAGPLPPEEIAAMTAFLREMAVMRLLETGMLRADDDRYRVEFRFEQGVPIVNGKLLGPGGLMAVLTGA